MKGRIWRVCCRWRWWGPWLWRVGWCGNWGWGGRLTETDYEFILSVQDFSAFFVELFAGLDDSSEGMWCLGLWLSLKFGL